MEYSYDKLEIFHLINGNYVELYVLTGELNSGTYTSQGSNDLHLRFISDSTVNAPGYKITVTVLD